jgi:hypothetical protein
MQLLCEVEEDPEWALTVEGVDMDDMLDDGEELEEVGARVVDGLSRALGGKAVLPVAFSVLPQVQ